MATATVGKLAACRVEASYQCLDGMFVRFPFDQTEQPGIEQRLREYGCDGQFDMGIGRWAWALALSHRGTVNGCIVLSARSMPLTTQIRCLTILGQQAGAALAYATMHERHIAHVERLASTNDALESTNHELATAVSRLRRQANTLEVLSAAVASGMGEQGIADALHDLTALPVGVEDKFGNLRCWAGPAQPHPYPKQATVDRELLLHELTAQNGPRRFGGRVLMLVQRRTDILGVVVISDPNNAITEDSLLALRHGAIVLGLELGHRRNLAELELKLRCDLVDDLLAGADRSGAYARADALGHDLRRPHYVVVVRVDDVAESVLAAAAVRAVAALQLNYLQGRHGGLIVLLIDSRPDPQALHHAISEKLGRTTSVIGIGSRCDVPDELPRSYTEALRALNIRLRSANPEGVEAFDELGFYRLIDAAHDGGSVEAFVREWLGSLIDYDESRNSELVQTLSDYLECGGNYDESAAALHIHRSTLRYRLARIAELTGHDLHNVDTRFNLHAATRAWRFLNTDA
ncbi:PucR family transcriptional regulator [Mycolicibacterium rhodesiae]|uniref:PucR family transcriptional regulator n=1 Tax=Mycolicibacterium rhodesiae TaxID=36814 RepID=UPI0021F378AD|nr:helix-turn-helix domain-containing protein [Mycolicibacterium rhodesiae]